MEDALFAVQMTKDGNLNIVYCLYVFTTDANREIQKFEISGFSGLWIYAKCTLNEIRAMNFSLAKDLVSCISYIIMPEHLKNIDSIKVRLWI